MSLKKQHCHSTSAVMGSFSVWGQQHSSSNERAKQNNEAFNQLQNCLVLRQLTQHTTELASMSNTSQKQSIPLLEKWNRSGVLIVIKWQKNSCSILMKHTRPLAEAVLKVKCEHFERPLEIAQIRWLLPIRKDSQGTRWVLELKMQVCSMGY